MKPLVIYHADCTDGFSAAFAAWLKLGDDAEYWPVQYSDANSMSTEPLRAVSGREVYILDFSFPRAVMDYIFANAKHVVWLDHHKTAFEMWCGTYSKDIPYESDRDAEKNFCDPHYIVLDNNKSGALLAWEYFHLNTEVPMLIKHIDDRDRWQFKLEGSKELHAALASYKPWSFSQWEQILHLEKCNNLGWESLFDEGKAILRTKAQHVASMVKQARKCEIQFDTTENLPPSTTPWRGGELQIHGIRREHHRFLGLAVNATLHASEVGQELANQSCTFGLVWYVAAGNNVHCSLRSNGNYDVSAIAKVFGGGGHKNAAGFETDITTLMGWLK